MSSEIAITVKSLDKDFKLPHEKVSSIKGLFTGLLKGKMRLKYETQHALKDISFEVMKGEFFGIVGRNGSGKSTLLKIIAGIYQPTSGSIHVNGKLVPFIELGVGFNPELTGRENVYLNGAILGFTKQKIDRNYQKIVEFSELEEFMDQKLKNYSSGMQVRLAFACATRAEAEVLLVDEVLAVGDSDFQRKCFTFFKDLKRQKKTVIFVTHDMDAVAEYCDRALLINNSRIVKIDRSDKIANEYRRLFLCKAKENTTSTGKRWGDRTIVFQNIGVGIDQKYGQISLAVDALIKKDIEDPIFGFKIIDSSGNVILGTNTKIIDQPPGKLTSGTKINLRWTFDNILSDGKYFIEPAVVYSNGIDVCDWWEEACSFVIKKSKSSHYLVDPTIKLKLT